jgi:hypothetical protein
MLYRAVHEMDEKLDELERHTRAAILAGDTRTVSAEAAAAQAITVELLDRLKHVLASGDERDVDRRFVEAAISCLAHAWNNVEKVGLGTNVNEMRARLLDFKTPVDYAIAYLRLSIGMEAVG